MEEKGLGPKQQETLRSARLWNGSGFKLSKQVPAGSKDSKGSRTTTTSKTASSRKL